MMPKDVLPDNENWIELAAAACNHAGVYYDSIESIATWDQKYCANAVYNIGGQQYLKIFGPTAVQQFYIERSALRTLETQNRIPVPRIVVEGERGGERPYLIITAIPGDTAEHIWDNLSRTEQLTIARELGTLTSDIHHLPQNDLASVEQEFGGRNKHIKRLQPRRIAEIEAAKTLSSAQRSKLLHFLQVEAPQYINGSSRLTHFDLAHNHIYLSRATGVLKVSGIIDWGEAMLGPPEWDVAYLWFWTFSRDREAMRQCLQTLYADRPIPDQFARRCLASVLYTSSMSLLWPYFSEQESLYPSIVAEMIEFFFPPDMFGSSD
jgi:Ser/Thr protein kinase RdoA (MazF antagonist)